MSTYPAFSVYGVEIELMWVDAATLAVRPEVDRVLEAIAGTPVDECDVTERIACSNELVMHVLELKTRAPSPSLEGLGEAFLEAIDEVHTTMGDDARLLGTAMHPRFDPRTETRLWPHGQREVYETFDRIFDCRGHGWSNLQSTHLNLPFASDTEFGRLHAAVRVLLPLLPALAASSPFVEGHHRGVLDERLAHYRENCARIPSVTGAVIPERLFRQADYEREVFDRIARDVAPFDPEGHLEPLWTNARGVIARFDRGAIEIRVLDVQETPVSDLAILAFVAELAKALVGEELSSFEAQAALDEHRLDRVFRETTARGSAAGVDDAAFLAALGLDGGPKEARAILESLYDRLRARIGAEHRAPIEQILTEGNLAERLLRRLGPAPTEEAIARAYAEVARCLPEGRLFRPGD